MSTKVTTIAAGLITAALATAATAQDCAETKPWVDPNNVKDALFAAPVANWNDIALKTFGPETLQKLEKEARDIPKDLGKDADRIFDDIEDSSRDGKEAKWESILEKAHPAIVPVLEDLKAGKITLDEARSTANVEISAYAKAASAKLAEITQVGKAVCVVFTGASSSSQLTPKKPGHPPGFFMPAPVVMPSEAE